VKCCSMWGVWGMASNLRAAYWITDRA
jgi:hypothetical protein